MLTWLPNADLNTYYFQSYAAIIYLKGSNIPQLNFGLHSTLCNTKKFIHNSHQCLNEARTLLKRSKCCIKRLTIMLCEDGVLQKYEFLHNIIAMASWKNVYMHTVSTVNTKRWIEQTILLYTKRWTNNIIYRY